MDNLIFVAAAIAVIAVIIILVLITGYVKAPTDTAVIISGLKKEPKYVIGRSSIKIPFLQRTDNNNINVATDFGEKLAENVTKETVDEMKTAPMAKPSKRRVNVTPENKQ